MTEPNTTPEFRPITDPRPFHVTPDEIIWRMRDGWLTDIENGFTPMIDTVVPYLEMEAVSRFKKEIFLHREWEPKITDGYESWRLFWLKEAHHNCKFYDPLGTANDHLSPICQAALNVMMAASALRDAIAEGKAEQASALGMVLICEAIQGGYSLEVEAMRQTQDAIDSAKKDRMRNTIGRTHNDLEKARTACIHKAKQIWAENPALRIGQIADECKTGLLRNLDKLPTMSAQDIPEIETIKAWLKDAAAAKKLKIPEGAQKPGRPPKATGK